VLAELADLLAEEVFPGDALPQLCRWLSGTVDATVAMVLLTDDAVDDVSAWPEDDPVVAQLTAVAGGPLAEDSTIWDAVSYGRSFTGGPDEPLVLPDGEAADRIGGWAVVPVLDRGVAFGALVVIGSRADGLPATTVSLVEDVAQRVARALLNCEEAASSAPPAPDGDGLPRPVRDRLAALSFVLEAIEAPPRAPLQGDQQRQYAQITAAAARLQDQVAGLLGGPGGARS
jgi:GAF domain-containing protein